MTAVDVEVTIPGEPLDVRSEEVVQSAARLLAQGARVETVLRTVYFFGKLDGGLEMSK